MDSTELCTCSYFGADLELLLCDHHRRSLWDLGFYGNKPSDCLIKLTDYEKLYLVKKEVLKKPPPGSFESFFETVCQNQRDKKIKYKTYEVLRDAGWIVRSGLNYGTDFVLYQTSPDSEHAEYAVVAIDEDVCNDCGMTWRRLLGINRSCVGAKKKLIVAVVSLSADSLRLLEVERWQPEAERMIPSQRLSSH